MKTTKMTIAAIALSFATAASAGNLILVGDSTLAPRAPSMKKRERHRIYQVFQG